MKNLYFNHPDHNDKRKIDLKVESQRKEKILEKLIDINYSHGTAYTILGAVSYKPMQEIIESGALESILKYGILGQTGFYENGQTFVEGATKEPITATSWKNNVRSHKNTLIFLILWAEGLIITAKK